MPAHRLILKLTHAVSLGIFSISSLLGLCAPAFGQGQRVVRVASYNIRFLNSSIPTTRLDRLRTVIDRLKADVIGLQEIDDRAALNHVFPPQDWFVIIDDDSGNNQDVAVAVRKTLGITGFSADLEAEDEHFLFPSSSNNSFFPNRRDVLFVKVDLAEQSESFFVLVHHAKSRSANQQPHRAGTDFRREGAARQIVQMLKERFGEKDFVLLGDFNDNPDDRSLNILETGDPNAQGGPEEIEGPFLINLMEPLCTAGHVSHGRNNNDIMAGRIDTVDPTSRKRNNDGRGTNTNTGDILFDQLLIPTWMKSRFITGSAKVFDDPVAVQGSGDTRASDHLPVYADFVFGSGAPDDGVVPAPGLRIISLLPNPVGTDDGREAVTLGNFTTAQVSLNGWKLRDKSGATLPLSSIVDAGGRRTIALPSTVLRLNNGGDEVSLVNPAGQVQHRVSYTGIQAQAGQTIVFP